MAFFFSWSKKVTFPSASTLLLRVTCYCVHPALHTWHLIVRLMSQRLSSDTRRNTPVTAQPFTGRVLPGLNFTRLFLHRHALRFDIRLIITVKHARNQRKKVRSSWSNRESVLLFLLPCHRPKICPWINMRRLFLGTFLNVAEWEIAWQWLRERTTRWHLTTKIYDVCQQLLPRARPLTSLYSHVRVSITYFIFVANAEGTLKQCFYCILPSQ